MSVSQKRRYRRKSVTFMLLRVHFTSLIWFYSVIIGCYSKRGGFQSAYNLTTVSSDLRSLAVGKIKSPVRCNMTQNYSNHSATVQPNSGNQTQSSKTNSMGQNNLDDLWTWSINGSKIDGSLSFLTGAVKLVEKVLSYWRDEVLTWWDRFQNRCSRWSSGIELSEEDEEETSDEGEFEETTDEDR